MPSMSTTYTFSTGTVIDSLQMNQNFIDVKLAYNTYAVQTDGTVQATTASLGTGIVTTAKLADLGVTTAKLADSSVTSAKIVDDSIVNADINSAAAIAYSKLNLATSIVNGDISASAAIALSKLATTGTLTATTFVGALTGTASGNLVSGGALGTPASGNLGNCTFPTLNQNTTGSSGSCTGNAATASSVSQSGITGMKQVSSTTTLYNSNGSFAIAHGIGTTPSNVIAVNGDYGAVNQAITLTISDGTYIFGKFLNTTANVSVRVNWIAFW